MCTRTFASLARKKSCYGIRNYVDVNMIYSKHSLRRTPLGQAGYPTYLGSPTSM